MRKVGMSLEEAFKALNKKKVNESKAVKRTRRVVESLVGDDFKILTLKDIEGKEVIIKDYNYGVSGRVLKLGFENGVAYYFDENSDEISEFTVNYTPNTKLITLLQLADQFEDDAINDDGVDEYFYFEDVTILENSIFDDKEIVSR